LARSKAAGDSPKALLQDFEPSSRSFRLARMAASLRSDAKLSDAFGARAARLLSRAACWAFL